MTVLNQSVEKNIKALKIADYYNNKDLKKSLILKDGLLRQSMSMS